MSTVECEPWPVAREFDAVDDHKRLSAACQQLAQDWTQEATDDHVGDPEAAACAKHAEQLRALLRGLS